MHSTRKTLIAFAVLALAVTGTLWAHDMFLKLPSFFLEPNATARIALLNGTFDESENAIARDRMTDVSVVGPDGVAHPPTSAWRDSAVHHWSPDSVDTAFLEFRTGGPGTYVIGVSTAPRVFDLSAEDFNAYLEHDGVVDVLAEREKQGRMGEPATERYSKHVKAVAQVGDARTGTFGHELGYPVEFVPLGNPYELGVGDALEVRFLRAGEPVADQIVYASYEGHHGHDDSGGHVEAVTTRTDAGGVARIPLEHAGKWYVRTIHMVETTGEPEVDYESNWATLTFEIR
jgi:hypothetical protein